jgi:dienelactone hydrolase
MPDGHRRHDLYRSGSGPGVVVIHEMPGLHPGVIEFARILVAGGYTVYLPSLFGRVGAPPTMRETLRSVGRVCVAREFRLLADRTSPVATPLRTLAAQAHKECGGRGVGAVGMCFTGGFALAMTVEPSVTAAVLSQPALPAPMGRRRRAALGLDAPDLTRVKDRTKDDLRVLSLRFTADRGCPPERFQTLRRELGESFESIEIDSSPGNRHGIPQHAHSVLTVDLVDEPGHPTRVARDWVITFLDERLH